jgi:hypothetical protein
MCGLYSFIYFSSEATELVSIAFYFELSLLNVLRFLQQQKKISTSGVARNLPE